MFVLMAVEDQLERLMSIQISNIGLELLSKPKPTFCSWGKIVDAKVASFTYDSIIYSSIPIANNQKTIFWEKNYILSNENVILVSMNSTTFENVFAHDMVVTFKF